MKDKELRKQLVVAKIINNEDWAWVGYEWMILPDQTRTLENQVLGLAKILGYEWIHGGGHWVMIDKRNK